jgi:hypothetical protein
VSDKDSDSDKVVTEVVTVAESVTVGLHLYFRAVGRGKERWL